MKSDCEYEMYLCTALHLENYGVIGTSFDFIHLSNECAAGSAKLIAEQKNGVLVGWELIEREFVHNPLLPDYVKTEPVYEYVERENASPFEPGDRIKVADRELFRVRRGTVQYFLKVYYDRKQEDLDVN